ncbi:MULTISPECIES: cytochrome d ubiquinol oxidase subunit II [unclassified Streptomyces]|uniref:cytochrome d ubiquinol oxidase subunit II n=1 Tax=unclassified Streptomyces TaxID=2593676 RepID=UPI00225BA3B1|nr:MULTISPECIES: cytochrome d ubiquinol oxidase subunit II [unclassified Streptomyces]MCX4524127.1 cytochrome d ubiquinol oxidase subunit II [Streptomyces sp. NBC_01551]MCX4545355.1 cytochrome d ubiquinol oxidase subunit II [Streptomyces sp. NBC_01565]
MTASIVAWILLLVIAAYACGGGVDYGAGFWDLCAGGAARGKRPRWLIDHAMAPVWEVNNVWLIFVLILMWTGFPEFFQTVFTALWLPLVLAAVGMVLRGAGFAFRKPTRNLAGRRVYGVVFAVSSLLTPFFLGTVIGSVASGRVAPGTVASAHAWANTTSITAGLVAVAATAFLGAVFLSVDARRFGAGDLIGYFRLRARIAGAALLVVGVIGLTLTDPKAAYVHHGLTHGAGLALLIAAVAALAVTAWLVSGPAAGWARYSSVATVALLIAAWGAAQRPYLVPTTLTVQQGAGASQPLHWLLFVTAVALVLIGPALVVLYRLDTRGVLEPLTDEDVAE